MLEKLWSKKQMQIQQKFTKLYGFYRGKYISELHTEEKEWGFFLLSLDSAMVLLPRCLEAVNKLEGLHRKVHELSNVL